MDGQRQAALALHGLQEPDRAWMLGQLGEAERAQVSRLLTELRDLGIPREPIPIPAQPRPATALERVKAAKPARMRRLLRAESVDFVAAVLAMEPWPWKAAYLARLPRARRAAIESRVRAREQQPSADRLREALIARIDPKLTLTPFSWLRTPWTRR